MNAQQAISGARQVFGVVCMICAALLILKMTGIVSIKLSSMDLALAAIACGLAK